MKEIIIAPSILAANFGALNEDIKAIEGCADWLHIDVMDGLFVDNISMGPPVIKHIKTKLPMDFHLMVYHPEKYIEKFVECGAFNITVHQEACGDDLLDVLKLIKSYGIKASVSIKPYTQLTVLNDDILNLVDMVLLMTVEPGFGGQKFINKMIPKIKKLRVLKPDLNIEVDGGINDITGKLAVKAGANVLVAGSYIFKADDYKKAVDRLRE